MGTGVTSQVWSPGDFELPVVSSQLPEGLLRTTENRQLATTISNGSGRSSCKRPVSKGRINAVKRLAVSTGRLRRLLALHFRPIDLVVFQEPSFLRTGDLVLRKVSRLYAFSVYPDRT